MNKSAKVSFTLAFILVLFLLVLFTIGGIACVRAYSKSNIEYSDLYYEELTFDRLEHIHGSKGSSWYKIYFNEYSEFFSIASYEMRYVNHDKMETLKKGDIVCVYFQDDDGSYDICEISSMDDEILSLKNHIKATKRNLMIGIILCPIMVLDCIFIMFFFIRKYRISKRYKSDPQNYDTKGELKIEYKNGGNVIQIFNSPTVCSLVINGVTVDQYFGMVATRFTLRGYATLNESKIPVEAKMGFLNMHLYYNGKIVAKEFKGLG